MDSLRETEEGVILLVKVLPKSRQDLIVGWENQRLKIKVRSPPERGEANKAVIRLISKSLEIPQNQVILLKGATSRQKIFLIKGLNLTQIAYKIP